MNKKLLLAALALCVTACVPITPEPDLTNCSLGYLNLRPGQSAEDPPSDYLPEYIDIVGADSRLEGETLTATIYLRGIPEELTVNRDGVESYNLEYSWSVEIDVEGESRVEWGKDRNRVVWSEARFKLMDYVLGSFSSSMRVLADSEPAIRPFGSLFQTEVWKYEYDPGEDEYDTEKFESDHTEVVQLRSIATGARLEISHEDNSLTLIGKVPGITPNSHLFFSTFDFLEGQDGVSCQPN